MENDEKREVHKEMMGTVQLGALSWTAGRGWKVTLESPLKVRLELR
jgi:hypothetical protein